uniref:Solute carrier family 9 regulator 2-like n=1 Tax=Schyzocotyle acheilognathi TaxID=135513 RepID=Q5VKJ0_SCHAC|nr:solute carrier family 9 regulator 2-like [Schyzocotyle acheilognathi]
MESTVPKARLIFIKQWQGFEGYGFTLENKPKKDYHKVKEVKPNSPAAAAGILVNDLIIEVNGIDVEKMPYKQFVEKIKTNANDVTLFVIQESELYCVDCLGTKIKSSSYPYYKVNGRSGPDSTTEEVEKSVVLSDAERALIRADANTLSAIGKKREELLCTLLEAVPDDIWTYIYIYKCIYINLITD